MKLSLVVLFAGLLGCASLNGVPPNVTRSCETRVQDLLRQYGSDVGGDVRMCAFHKLMGYCEDAAWKKAQALERKTPTARYFIDNPGEWDQDAFDTRQERLDEAFKTCGDRDTRYKALGLVQSIFAAGGGRIDWEPKCGSCGLN